MSHSQTAMLSNRLAAERAEVWLREACLAWCLMTQNLDLSKRLLGIDVFVQLFQTQVNLLPVFRAVRQWRHGFERTAPISLVGYDLEGTCEICEVRMRYPRPPYSIKISAAWLANKPVREPFEWRMCPLESLDTVIWFLRLPV